VVNIKNLTLLLILYTSLIIGFIFNENLNFGTYYDWIQVNSLLIEDFSKNFSETFFNYHKTGNRHSPIYSIFLSFFYKLGLNIDFIRLFHLHICLGLIFLFYKCLVLRFEDVNKSTLQILSMFIFLSPTYRSLSIWPDSRLPGLIFFVLSVYFFLKFRKKKEKKIYNAYLCSFSLILSSYISPNFSLF